MKVSVKNCLSHSVVFAVFMSSSLSFAQDLRAMMLENSVVKSTYSLMQFKHNGACSELNEKSIFVGCTGLLPSVTQLKLLFSGCYVTATIDCPNEYALISGGDDYVAAIDETGIRQDIKRIELGLRIKSISLNPKK